VNQFLLMVLAIFVAVQIAPMSAMAQPKVTDSSAAVPSVVYQSVFNQSPVGVETKSLDWKKANEEVGQFKRGHVDILKWEESQPKGKLTPLPVSRAEALPSKAVQPAASGTHKH
jgi:hypothetical protein